MSKIFENISSRRHIAQIQSRYSSSLYTQVPNVIINTENLPSDVLYLYCWIAQREQHTENHEAKTHGFCISYLAVALGWSRQRVRNAYAYAKEHGWMYECMHDKCKCLKIKKGVLYKRNKHSEHIREVRRRKKKCNNE